MRVTVRFALILLVGAVSCGGGGEEEVVVEPPQPLLSDIQAKILSPSCAAFSSCHSTAGRAGMCDLTAGRSYDQLVGRTSPNVPSHILVVPGHPEQSFLISKLRGDLNGGEGDRMPLRNPPLQESQIEAIEAWITAGAPNN